MSNRAGQARYLISLVSLSNRSSRHVDVGMRPAETGRRTTEGDQKTRTNRRTTATVVAAALGTLLLWTTARVASAEPLKNIVLVHGAFVDGSGWRAVYDILVRDGYTVSVSSSHSLA